MKLAHLAITLFTVLLVGCGPTAQNVPQIHFVQQKEIPNVYMEADLRGKLVLVKGCLRLQNAVSDYLIVWPWGFSLRVDGEIIEILDSNGQMVTQVGDNLMLSGGERPRIDDLVSQMPPEECPGLYWIVGSEIRKIE